MQCIACAARDEVEIFVNDGAGTADKAKTADAGLLAMAEAARAAAVAGMAKVSAIAQRRCAAADAKGLKVGSVWHTAQSYIPGKNGITTFRDCRILAIDDDGMIKVQATQRGSSAVWLLTVEPDSRIFDTFAHSALPQSA